MSQAVRVDEVATFIGSWPPLLSGETPGQLVLTFQDDAAYAADLLPFPTRGVSIPFMNAKRTTRQSSTPAPGIKRRDATGHLDPKYAADLRALSGNNHGDERTDAFLRGARAADPLAEELGEDFVKAATSGQEAGEDTLDQAVSEESGGPFVMTDGSTEFADDIDASNPEGATREPFPRT